MPTFTQYALPNSPERRSTKPTFQILIYRRAARPKIAATSPPAAGAMLAAAAPTEDAAADAELFEAVVSVASEVDIVAAESVTSEDPVLVPVLKERVVVAVEVVEEP